MDTRFASLTPELIEKYSIQGPYYTSYPTGRQWTEDFGPEDFRRGLKELLASDPNVPLSLYLHIPFCKRRCRFCFCFAEITRSREKMDEFLGVLFEEIRLFRRLFDTLGVEPNIREIHLGGGSPSYLALDQIKTLIEHLRPLVSVESLDEFTLETDAITVTSDKLLACRELGVSRLSFGIQDFDEQVQRAIGRVQSPELIAGLMTPAVRRSFRSINFDLMFGLPFQTRSSFRETIAKVVDLSPARAAIYSYFHMPEMYPNQSPIRQADLPGLVEKAFIFADAAQAFVRSGYEFIGIDHFSRPTDDLAKARNAGALLRHFMGYTAGRTPHLIGLGPTSISGFGDCYAHNTYSMDEYRQAIHAGKLPLLRGYRMTEDDEIRWAVISRFLAYMSVEFRDIDERFGIDCRSYFAKELAGLEPFIENGLVERSEGGFRATELGALFARHVCVLFDRYAPVDGRSKKNQFVPAIQRSQC
ncbi:MAG TPA: oxygen-independent coproporphyrinogen III oxidase [Sedimentisphaerales bacterium]|nr:oxygen-independent coproporphyrinogen III oxidase [Sedimentisphaerales bacterium]